MEKWKSVLSIAHKLRSRQPPIQTASSTSDQTIHPHVEKSSGHVRRDPIAAPILERRARRLQNDLAHLVDPPQIRRRSRFRPQRIRIGELIHPVDLINKKIPGVRNLDGARLAGFAETLRPVIFPEETTHGPNSLEEILKQREEELMISEKKSLLQHETTYVNPICMEMDKLLLALNSIDDVLSHVISHRGVFYVHNLVTSIQLIAILSVKSKTTELTELDSDDRFQLLLSDLKENRNHLDLVASINTLLSLQRLGVRNFLMFNAFLEPLLNAPFKSDSENDITQVIRTAQVYRWSGYCDGVLFDHCARALEDGRIFLNKEILVEACKILGSLDSHHIAFFKSGISLTFEI